MDFYEEEALYPSLEQEDLRSQIDEEIEYWEYVWIIKKKSALSIRLKNLKLMLINILYLYQYTNIFIQILWEFNHMKGVYMGKLTFFLYAAR